MAPRTPLPQPARKRFASALAATAALALAFTGLTATLAPAPRAAAAAAPAFDCSNPRFFAQAEDPIGTVKLNTGTYESDGKSKWTALGPARMAPNVYNAVAFNRADDYLYGTIYGTSGGATPGSFVRIDRDGNLTNLGVSSPALGSGYSTLWDSGEFDASGTYYVASGNAGTTKIYKITGLKQVTSSSSTPRPTRTEVTLTQSVRAADFTFIDGFLWAPNYGQSSTLYRIDVNGKLGTVGAVRAFTLPAATMPKNDYGSAFTMTNGNLALVATNGHMYQISIDDPGSNAPSFELISDVEAPANQRSNATNCASALPSSLSVVKEGPETVVVGETITWTITVTNDGPGVTSGFVLNDLMPDGLDDIAFESDDTSCKLTGTPKRITCIGGLLPVGETATVIVTATAPDEPTALRNSASVIGNEDPDPDPAVSVDTEVVRATIVDTALDIEAEGTVDDYDTASTKGGTVSFANGEFTYTPPDGFSGIDRFTYRTPDGEVTVIIYVRPTADPTSDTTHVAEDVEIDVATLLGLAAGSDLVFTSVGNPSHGTVVRNGTTVTFAPETGYAGTASFDYVVTDGEGQTATNTVTITVLNIVTADDDAASTTAGTAVDIDVRDGDTSAATNRTLGDPRVTDGPDHGSTSIVGGKVRYTPAAGFSGVDTFSYEVCDSVSSTVCGTAEVTVTVANVFVPGTAASGITTPHNTPHTVDLDDIVDPSGEDIVPTRVTQKTAPAHGAIEIDEDTGDVTYTPTPGYTGTDSFAVTLCDANGECTDVTIPVTVGANTVTADDETATTPYTTAVTIDVRDGDTSASGQPLAVPTVIAGPGDGVTRVESDGRITYTPNSGFSGQDTFTYKVCDTSTPTPACATADVTVTVGNLVTAVDDSDTTPFETAITLDVRGNDTSASGQSFAAPTVTRQPASGTGVVAEVGGELRYTPAGGFTGATTFAYRVCDTSTPTAACDTAEVTITVTNVFTPGTAVVDGISTPHNTPHTIDLDDITTTSGAPLDPTAVTETDAPDHGTVDIDPVTGEVIYTPTPGYSGDDEFTLEVCDTSVPAQCTDVVIEVTVSPNAVAATDDSDTTEVATPVTVDVRDNDTTASGQPFAHPTVTRGPANGTATVNADGDIVYTPDAGFSGEDTFDYEVCDTSSTPVCRPATVTITVLNVFVPGTPVTDGVDTKHGEPVTIPLDDVVTVPGSPLDPTTVTVVDRPDHGSVDVDPQTGELVYTPGAGFSGDDQFDIEVCDTSVPVQCATLTVTVHVAKAALAGTGVDGVLASVATSIGAALLGLLLMLGARRARRSRAAV